MTLRDIARASAKESDIGITENEAYVLLLSAIRVMTEELVACPEKAVITIPSVVKIWLKMGFPHKNPRTGELHEPKYQIRFNFSPKYRAVVKGVTELQRFCVCGHHMYKEDGKPFTADWTEEELKKWGVEDSRRIRQEIRSRTRKKPRPYFNSNIEERIQVDFDDERMSVDFD